MADSRLDATALRALAHPLRARLFGALRTGGPASATALARELGTNSGATSYHLRRLAENGLVQDTGQGSGRTRLWRADVEAHALRVDDLTDDEDAETTLGWLNRDYLRLLAERGERWLDAERTWPARWREAAGLRDDSVVATAEQVAALQEEIREVVARYRRVGAGNPAARRVAVWTVALPIDVDRAPRSDLAE